VYLQDNECKSLKLAVVIDAKRLNTHLVVLIFTNIPIAPIITLAEWACPRGSSQAVIRRGNDHSLPKVATPRLRWFRFCPVVLVCPFVTSLIRLSLSTQQRIHGFHAAVANLMCTDPSIVHYFFATSTINHTRAKGHAGRCFLLRHFLHRAEGARKALKACASSFLPVLLISHGSFIVDQDRIHSSSPRGSQAHLHRHRPLRPDDHAQGLQ